MRAVLPLVVVAVVLTSCGPSSPATPPPLATSGLPDLVTASWGHTVTWPGGDTISVAEPRFRDDNGTVQKAWVIVPVTVTNKSTEPRRLSTHRWEATTDGRSVKGIVADEPAPLAERVLDPSSAATFSLVFATGTLGRSLELTWSSPDARRWPTTRVAGTLDLR